MEQPDESPVNTVYWKTLIEIADTGSFARAAERLCVTQSALSRRVNALEEHYSCQLLDRAKQPVTLTSAGKVVATRARDILKEEARISRRVARLKKCRQIDFACTSAVSIAALPTVLQLMMARSAGAVELNCSTGPVHSIVEATAAGSLDMAVVDHCASLDLSQLDVVELGEETLLFACSADVRLAKGDSLWSALLEHTLVVRSEASCSRRLLEAELESRQLTIDSFQKVVVTDDLNVALNLLKSGDTVTCIPRSLIQGIVNGPGGIQLRQLGQRSCLRRSLVHSASRAPTPAEVILRQAILDAAASGWDPARTTASTTAKRA